jgi:hypothetical protein
MSRAAGNKTAAQKEAERLSAELETIPKSSRINREKLDRLWTKIEGLDAAIQSNRRARLESQLKRNVRKSGTDSGFTIHDP